MKKEQASKEPPVYPDWPDAGDSLMSNFDGEVDEAIAAKLRSGQFTAGYPGWNFHARCWFADGQYHARVKVYCSVRGYYSADTPKELMRAISERYGYE